VYRGTKRIAVQWMRVGVDLDSPWDSFDTNTVKKKVRDDEDDEEGEEEEPEESNEGEEYVDEEVDDEDQYDFDGGDEL
jgi:hypothetical protein